MIIKRLYSSQEVVEGLHLVWDVFIRENANSCTQQGIEEFARFIKMENFMPLVDSGEMIVFGAVEGQDLGGVGCGLYGMLAFAILTVFIAGLMVGRTP